MAELDYSNYKANGILSAGFLSKTRTLEFYIDFTKAANQLADAADTLNIAELPKGTVVVGGGIEQIVAGSSGNTLVARWGTTALSTTLASDAAVGTVTAAAATSLSGDAQSITDRPYTLTAATDFNLLSASAVRATGKVRAFIVIQEGKGPYPAPELAARDASTGLA